MLISVVIPAFEEENYLGRTLDSLNGARALLAQRAGVSAVYAKAGGASGCLLLLS